MHVDTKKELYKKMLLIRQVEEAIADKYSEQEMRCPTHLSIGQEAVAAAVGLALNANDQVVSTHRSHAHYLGKGGSLKRMIAELYGKATGCSSGKGGSMHLIDQDVGFMGSTAIVGNSIPIGAGLALSYQLDGSDRVAVIFIGDGATEEGVFAETVNFAALKKLPLLFVCENNLYSVYSPLANRQPFGRSIAKMVEGMGVMVAEGDGNNAIKAFELTQKTISKIRSGGGPWFLEFSTYRWLEHCGANYDNHIGYRIEDEFQSWKERDPVKFLEGALISNNEITVDELDSIHAEVKNQISDAFQFAVASSYPNPEEAFTQVLAR
jgi:TPP-dependent pyruvate/acetoin dehydrogenase alpha subunit